MHVVHDEDPARESGERLLHRLPVERTARRRGRSLEPVEDARLVALGLQSAEEPRAGVRESLVVEVDRILRRQHDADAERARLLEQRQQRRLRRRIGHRREVAEDFVHVDDGPQARRAGLAPHPSERLVEQQRDEEHALGVAEMRNRADRDARLAVGGVEQPVDVEGFALHPHVEPGRRQQVVERHRQREPILGREERVEIHDADARHRRRLNLLNDVRQASGPAPASTPTAESSRAGCARGS